MSANRNWEQEHYFALMSIKEYVKDEGADNLLKDLATNFPEVYMEIMEAVNHKLNSLDRKDVPALLRNYRKE